MRDSMGMWKLMEEMGKRKLLEGVWEVVMEIDIRMPMERMIISIMELMIMVWLMVMEYQKAPATDRASRRQLLVRQRDVAHEPVGAGAGRRRAARGLSRAPATAW